MLRVTAHDKRTWSVRGRLPDGKRIRPTIGTYPGISIREARRRALKLLGEIAGGIDPTAVRQVAAQARTAPRVAARFEEWRDAKARDWSSRYAAEVERVCNMTILPRVGKRLLAETTREDWVGLATALRKHTPAKAAWVYDVVSSFLNYAEAVGWLPVNPLPRRGRGHIAPKVAARERVLRDDELVRVWQASSRLRLKARVFARLLIMTGARVSEVAGIAVGEVDLLTGRWRIPGERAKNGNAIVLPLHPLLQTELHAVWPHDQVSAGFQLLGTIRGSALKAPSKVKASLDRYAGLEPWRWHDLRRSARTGMARLGIDKDIAELALNHISGRSSLVRVYDRHDYETEILAALRRWQDYIAHILDASHKGALDVEAARA
jgi:integrase